MTDLLSLPRLATLALIFTYSLLAADLAPLLQPILEKSKLPSLAAAVVTGDKIEGSGAVRLMRAGEPTPVIVDDKYHLGYCTAAPYCCLCPQNKGVSERKPTPPFSDSFGDFASAPSRCFFVFSMPLPAHYSGEHLKNP